MKDNSKSGLCMKQVICATMALMTLTAHIQLFVSVNDNTLINTKSITLQAMTEEITQEKIQKMKQVEKNQQAKEIQQEETKIAQEDETQKIVKSVERKEVALARAGQERQIQLKTEQFEKKYISIDEMTISKDMDLSKRCGISKEDFKILMANLKTDTSGFFKENSDIIYDLCEKYEINEIFFCGLIVAESGWDIASNHRNTNNYISMMSKGRLIHYSSTNEGLEAAAKLLHNNYLSSDGAYYHGATLSGVQKCFCPESTWAKLVYNCMEQIVK